MRFFLRSLLVLCRDAQGNKGKTRYGTRYREVLPCQEGVRVHPAGRRRRGCFRALREIKDDGSTNKFKMLYEGDRVEYTPAPSGKGTQAKEVVKLSSGEARSE